ncbi:hypothetical protein SRHO_G00175260 [Serrasalmus rhombeus]
MFRCAHWLKLHPDCQLLHQETLETSRLSRAACQSATLHHNHRHVKCGPSALQPEALKVPQLGETTPPEETPAKTAQLSEKRAAEEEKKAATDEPSRQSCQISPQVPGVPPSRAMPGDGVPWRKRGREKERILQLFTEEETRASGCSRGTKQTGTGVFFQRRNPESGLSLKCFLPHNTDGFHYLRSRSKA